MQREDMQDAIPLLGLCMKFREKLFAWKKAGTNSRFDTDLNQQMFNVFFLIVWNRRRNSINAIESGGLAKNFSMSKKLFLKLLINKFINVWKVAE